MKTEIIINAATHETRIAIIEDSKVVEIWVERPENERMVGDIYKGTVKAVIPGIQAAFVDIGLEKSTFLHISDVSGSTIDFAAQYDDEGLDEDIAPEPEKVPPPAKSGKGAKSSKDRDKKTPAIESILTKDQELFVQITKEPISTKGARITSQVSLAGRFLVLMPGNEKVGVSRKISSWTERRRLRQLTLKYKPKGFGLIIRTVADGKGEKVIASEIKELVQTYEELMKKAETLPNPSLIHKEMGMTSGIIRDLLSEDVERVLVDSKEHYEEIRKYIKNTSPKLAEKVNLYSGKEPIFDHFDLEQEIENLLSRKFWLKTGAFLVFDPTEALTVIDVNSGRNIGKKLTHEDTILKVNMESAVEIARQLRLRDIGGIIVIDFIDMINLQHRKKVEDIFANALKNDRSKISISQISEFGLMEMTRQRVRPSLIHTFAEPCPTCDGIGMVQGRDTTITKIERWFARAEVFGHENSYTVFVHPAVFEFLIQNEEERLSILRSSTKLTIDIVADAKIGIDEFHFFSTKGGVNVTDKYGVGNKLQNNLPEQDIKPVTASVSEKPVAASVSEKPVNGNEIKFGRKPRPRKRR